MSTRYLLVTAAAYRLLIDIGVVSRVEEGGVDRPGVVDLSRALGGEAAAVVVTCALGGQAVRLGVDGMAGMVVLAPEAFAPLPGLVAAAAGEDIDAVTLTALGGTHAFRLRLGA